MATRLIHNEDALPWLEARPRLAGCSFVTSLPDFAELSPMGLEDWKAWFVRAAALVLASCPDDGVALFFQTDIKHEGTWVDKAYLCQKAAEVEGSRLLFHKIVCRFQPGHATFGRPAYSHLVAFSRGVRAEPARSTADVLPRTGPVTWAKGMGTRACLEACRFILAHTGTRTVVDPFCGHGTVLAVANALGLDAVGVERGAKRAGRARELRVEDLDPQWIDTTS